MRAAIDELLPVMRRGDLAGFQRLYDRLATDGRRMSPDELTAAIGELAPVLAYRPHGVFARLALVAGASAGVAIPSRRYGRRPHDGSLAAVPPPTE